MPSNSILVSSFILAAVAAMALVLWSAQGPANEDGLLIAVFAPSASERSIMHAVSDSGGTFVRASLPATIIIAHSAQAGFADRLKDAGALLTFSQAPFGDQMAGCLALATAPYEPAVWR
jgi:hypothetical protein